MVVRECHVCEQIYETSQCDYCFHNNFYVRILPNTNKEKLLDVLGCDKYDIQFGLNYYGKK